MVFFNSKYTFTYSTTTLDKMLMTTLISGMWIGQVFELHEYGFRGDMLNKIISSIALLYLIWHFIASRKHQVIGFNNTGLNIPSIWLPGLTSRRIAWSDISDVDVGVKNYLPVIFLYLHDNTKHALYIKTIKIFQNKRPINKPDEKLFLYLHDILETYK